MTRAHRQQVQLDTLKRLHDRARAQGQEALAEQYLQSFACVRGARVVTPLEFAEAPARYEGSKPS